MAANSPWWTARLIQRSKYMRYSVLIPAIQSKSKSSVWNYVRCSSNLVEQNSPSQPSSVSKPTTKAITISKAVKSFIDKVKAHDDMMKAEVADYEIGKRHLANIMGEDPETFTQADINRAIQYLLPSGIFEKKARPIMANPYEIFPQRKAAQFGIEGRPFHWLYFTTLPNYYGILHKITCKMDALKALEDKFRAQQKLEELEGKSLNVISSEWITEVKFKEMLLEKISEKEYKHFIVMMERLIAHPLSTLEEVFVMKYRVKLHMQSEIFAKSQVECDSEGRTYAEAKGTRKHAEATVRVYNPGSGQVTVNNKDLSYFRTFLCRETIMCPLVLAKLVGAVDIVAEVQYGGTTAQAGAIRLGVSKALTAFVDDNVKEQLRLSGLLTPDPRKKERKKPGQFKARKKFTWKRR